MNGQLDEPADLAAQRAVELRRTLHPRTVSGDPVLLERLIGNLVHNAIRYNREHNTGRPVLSTMLAVLFEPFRRMTGGRTVACGSASTCPDQPEQPNAPRFTVLAIAW